MQVISIILGFFQSPKWRAVLHVPEEQEKEGTSEDMGVCREEAEQPGQEYRSEWPEEQQLMQSPEAVSEDGPNLKGRGKGAPWVWASGTLLPTFTRGPHAQSMAGMTDC